MRAVATFALLLASAVPAFAEDTVTHPFPGVTRTHRVTSAQNLNVVEVDLCAPGVKIRTTAKTEHHRVTSSFGAMVHAQVAINGDFFNVSTYDPTGLAAHGGTKWGPGVDDSFTVPVQFGAGHALIPGGGGTGGIKDWAKEVVSGHPSLIVAGEKRDNTNYGVCAERNPRTGIGLSEDKRTLYIAVVDGREGQRVGMTCAELGNLLAEFGATDAVNFDGGGSSTLWLEGKGVVSSPSDGSERSVSNHLAVIASGDGEATHCPAVEDPGSGSDEPTPPDDDPDVLPTDVDDSTDDGGGCATTGRFDSGALVVLAAAILGPWRRRVGNPRRTRTSSRCPRA